MTDSPSPERATIDRELLEETEQNLVATVAELVRRETQLEASLERVRQDRAKAVGGLTTVRSVLGLDLTTGEPIEVPVDPADEPS